MKKMLKQKKVASSKTNLKPKIHLQKCLQTYFTQKNLVSKIFVQVAFKAKKKFLGKKCIYIWSKKTILFGKIPFWSCLKECRRWQRTTKTDIATSRHSQRVEWKWFVCFLFVLMLGDSPEDLNMPYFIIKIKLEQEWQSPDMNYWSHPVLIGF